MKKRIPIVLMGLIVIFAISLVLFNRQANLHYGKVKEFCYKIQQAGQLIPPDPKTVSNYTVKTDRYGNLILCITGNEGEQIVCEMSPDCQLIDKINEVNALKYLYAIVAILSILLFIAVVKGCTKRRIGA